MKNLIKMSLVASALLLSSSITSAAPINVGGVIWDPDEVFNFLGSDDDASLFGNLIETATNGTPGDIVTGRGIITTFNATSANQAEFCPGCELTFIFEIELVSFTPVSGAFEFTNLSIDLFVDDSPDFVGTAASASDGVLFLSAVGNGNLIGIGTNIGTGSDTGTGSGLLDVDDGLAFANFDTNLEVNGADLVFSSSFQPITSQPGLLSGTLDLKGKTVAVPEPASLALLGLGLLGFGARRKSL